MMIQSGQTFLGHMALHQTMNNFAVCGTCTHTGQDIYAQKINLYSRGKCACV